MAVKYCPNCGKKNPIDAVQCKKCKTMLPQIQQQPGQWPAQPQYQQQPVLQQQQPYPQQQQPQPIQQQHAQPLYQQAQTYAGLDYKPLPYSTVPQTMASQPLTPQPTASPVQAPMSTYPQPVVQPMKNCPSCGRFIPKGASVCPKCNPEQQPVQATLKTPDVVKPEPPVTPPQTTMQPAAMPVKPLNEMPWDIQSPYPQEKQPADGILPTDFACPNCGDRTVFVNRYSSYYCYRCASYPWRCKSCKCSIPAGTDRCPRCAAKTK